MAAEQATEEHFDILEDAGLRTGRTAPRSLVHSEGLVHRAVHVWLLDPLAGELLLQQRAACKDSWPGRWDISCAGHLSAGDESLPAAQRELEEELGIQLPASRFELLFTHFERLRSVQRGKTFINNEYNDVYLITMTPEERQAWAPDKLALQESEVSAARYFPWEAVQRLYAEGDPTVVPCSDPASYSRLFDAVKHRVETATVAAT